MEVNPIMNANVTLVQDAYAAFGRGDIGYITEHCTTDTVLQVHGPANLPTVGTYHGREGVGRFFQAIASTQTEMSLTPERYITEGDTVVALCQYEARVKATGKKAKSYVAHFFRLRDGLLAEWVEV